MLAAADFFDLGEFAHRDLFAGLTYVWEALPRLAEYLRAHLQPGIEGTVMPHAFVGERVFVGEGTVVEPGACILGPAIIGRDCQVRAGAYVRENVIAGDGAVLGHASEFKNCVLLNRAGAPHFNYVGDSLLGADTNLGAGTKLSNVKVVGSTVTVTVEGRDYDTGLRKFGAVLGDGAQTGCGAVLNPGTLVGKRSLIYPLTSVRGYIPPDSIVKLRQAVEVEARR
jgi:NDP-sugar pyrophosphorylase family protein